MVLASETWKGSSPKSSENPFSINCFFTTPSSTYMLYLHDLNPNPRLLCNNVNSSSPSSLPLLLFSFFSFHLLSFFSLSFLLSRYSLISHFLFLDSFLINHTFLTSMPSFSVNSPLPSGRRKTLLTLRCWPHWYITKASFTDTQITYY